MKGLETKDVCAPLTSESSPSTERVVIAGYGRIGQNVAQGLQDAGVPHMVIEIDPERIAELRRSGKPRIYGDASNSHVLSQAGLNKATTLVVTFPDPLAVVNTVRAGLEINPDLNVVARVHRTREAEFLKGMGVTELISPEYEASLEFLKRTLAVSGWGKADVRRILPIVQEDREIIEFSSDKEE
jgi:CPA2 family monovalent cation:H+ antiporter-2